MHSRQLLLIALLACQSVPASTLAGERTTAPGALDGQKDPRVTRAAQAPSLDRVAGAVDSAESSHGKDPAMWRSDPSGPQGPMQVSEAAATDIGGGDRFDVEQNRMMGRAYLAQLYGRYGNWPDAIAAYNWGMGRMDAWLKAGRPPDGLLVGVAVYTSRVLNESGLCSETPARRVSANPGIIAAKPERPKEEQRLGKRLAAPPDTIVSAACTFSDTWRGAYNPRLGSSRFAKKLDQAMQLAVMNARYSR
jgi:hypothetical protein